MEYSEKTINKRNMFKGKVISLDVHDVMLYNNKIVEREIISHPGGVAVIPINKNKEVYLVKQFRKPYDCELIEIPAGKLEKGEKPEICGIRELREETGLKAGKVSFLTQMYPSPGYTDEVIYIYKAEELEEGEAQTDEDEFLNVQTYPISEAIEMINKGNIRDAKTIIALLFVNHDM